MIPLLFTLLYQPAAPTPQRCGIEGTVVSATTGAPLKKATVTLGSNKDLTVTTTAEGKFKFENVEPDDYTIKAERVGYLEGPETVLTLKPGENKTDFVVKLTPQGIISGRIVDEDGDPVVGARVAYIRWIAAGEKRFKLEEDSQDVNGEGGFTLTGLSAGTYYLQALPDRLLGGKPPSEDFAVTFYPNSLDLTGAGTLTIVPGGEIRNLEIRMRKSATFRVRGKVSVPQGPGVPSQLSLISQDSAEMAMGTGKSAAIEKGEFQFEAVPPGSYILQSSSQVPTGSTEEGTFSWGSAHFFFRQPIEVSDRDIDDLTVSFTPAIDMAGRFHSDGVTLSKTPSVMLVPELFPSGRKLKGEADSTGAFRIAQLPPDRFEVVVSNLPDGAYVKSIRQGAQEVKGPLDLTAGGISDPLEITLAPDAAEITGILRDTKGEPVPYWAVTLWTSDDQRDKSEITASDGSFTFKNLAPADYRLAGWSNIDSQIKPAFRKLYESQATAVTVHEGSHETAEVKVIVVQ